MVKKFGAQPLLRPYGKFSHDRCGNPGKGRRTKLLMISQGSTSAAAAAGIFPLGRRKRSKNRQEFRCSRNKKGHTHTSIILSLRS